MPALHVGCATASNNELAGKTAHPDFRNVVAFDLNIQLESVLRIVPDPKDRRRIDPQSRVGCQTASILREGLPGSFPQPVLADR
jgi:hypothetical protein